MTNRKALYLIALGLHPVRPGHDSDSPKRPRHKGWQTAVYTPADVARWPTGNNVGIRCRQQRDGRRALVIFDFNEDARHTFPDWQRKAGRVIRHKRLFKYIETLGSGQQVVAGGLIAWHQAVTGEVPC